MGTSLVNMHLLYKWLLRVILKLFCWGWHLRLTSGCVWCSSGNADPSLFLEMWLCDGLYLTNNIWTTVNNIHSVSVWLCCNAERIILRCRWGKSVPLKLLLRPLCSNLAQSTAAKFHELYRQALNPFLWSWSPTVIQADAIKKCLFMRLLTSKTFHQTNCASVTGLPPFLHVSEILFPPRSYSSTNHSWLPDLLSARTELI